MLLFRPNSQFRLYREITDAGQEELSPLWGDIPLGRVLQDEATSISEIVNASEFISDSLNSTYNAQLDLIVDEVRGD